MSTPNEPEHPERPDSAGPLEGADASSAERVGAASAPETVDRDPDSVDRDPETVDSEESDTSADQPLDTSDETARSGGDPVTTAVDPARTSIYVRRGRTPTLGFWVAVAIALPAVAALISAPFFDFADLGGVLNFVLLAAVMVGLPLAAVAAVIDSVRNRPKRSPRR